MSNSENLDLDNLARLAEAAQREYDAMVLSQRDHMALANECRSAIPALLAREAMLTKERDRALAKARFHECDWVAAKHEFGVAMGSARAEIDRLRKLVHKACSLGDHLPCSDEAEAMFDNIRKEADE